MINFQHYNNLLDELYDVYDKHLLFLATFDDIKPKVLSLSQAFVREHDTLMATMVHSPMLGMDAAANMMDVTNQILYLVHLKGGELDDGMLKFYGR